MPRNQLQTPSKTILDGADQVLIRSGEFDRIITAENFKSGLVQAANNLSDIADIAEARTNLGLTSAATTAIGGANGLAQLDASGKVPENLLPAIAAELAQLTDVTLTTPSNGQVLKYDGTKWINDADNSGISQLNELSDVTLTTPAQDQILQYDGTKWVNANAPATGAISSNAGDGLSFAAGALNVNVDNSTLAIAADALAVKDAGVSAVKFAADVVHTNGGLVQDGTSKGLKVSVDGSTITVNGSGQLQAAPAGIASVEDDIAPMLGGNLDVNGNAIVSSANADITLAPNGTGKVIASSVVIDGGATSGYILTANGLGEAATWQAAPAGGGGGASATESTWTPVVIGGTTAGTGSYATQKGNYQQVGNRVHFECRVTMTAHTGAGDFRISLPFACVTDTGYRVACAIRYSGLDIEAPLMARIDSGNDFILLEKSELVVGYGSEDADPAPYQIVSKSVDICVSGSYRVA